MTCSSVLLVAEANSISYRTVWLSAMLRRMHLLSFVDILDTLSWSSAFVVVIYSTGGLHVRMRRLASQLTASPVRCVQTGYRVHVLIACDHTHDLCIVCQITGDYLRKRMPNYTKTECHVTGLTNSLHGCCSAV
jgi:hypothetical protein